MEQILFFGNTKIIYTVCVSKKRKTLNIAVKDGQVFVTTPLGAKAELYEPLIRKKAPWILKQLAEYEEVKLSSRQLCFQSGEKLPYLGRHYRLHVTKARVSTPSLTFSKGRFQAVINKGLSLEEQRDQLYPLYMNWIREKGQHFAERRVERFVQRLGKAPSGIAVRNMEKRWGSCTPQQKILLNWRIFLAPVSMVDYVLAHEIAHLKELNHTPAYWETLRMLIPDYEERKEWLRINSNQLYI